MAGDDFATLIGGPVVGQEALRGRVELEVLDDAGKAGHLAALIAHAWHQCHGVLRCF